MLLAPQRVKALLLGLRPKLKQTRPPINLPEPKTGSLLPVRTMVLGVNVVLLITPRQTAQTLLNWLTRLWKIPAPMTIPGPTNPAIPMRSVLLILRIVKVSLPPIPCEQFLRKEETTFRLTPVFAGPAKTRGHPRRRIRQAKDAANAPLPALATTIILKPLERRRNMLGLNPMVSPLGRSALFPANARRFYRVTPLTPTVSELWTAKQTCLPSTPSPLLQYTIRSPLTVPAQ